MKKIVLTVDYELFLGSRTGDVDSCMIKPTGDLADILNFNNGKMTLFWDVLHYHRLKHFQDIIPAFKNEIRLIEEQILFLAKNGHDIQLHLHPHWLDANYVENRWNFDYRRFRIHDLSGSDDCDDINSISGCIGASKNLIQNLIHNIDKDYKVTTVRFGGYLVEPFDKLRESLIKHNILVESSINPGTKLNNGIFSFDFSGYPYGIAYRFSREPKVPEKDGVFTQVPIKTLHIPAIPSLYFLALRKLKYNYLKKMSKGSSTRELAKPRKRSLQHLVKNTLKTRIYQFTTDGNFKEIFYYMLNRVEENSTMILHSKMLNTHTFGLLYDLTKRNRIKFISIKDFLRTLEEN